jgi:hypothetical protein
VAGKAIPRPLAFPLVFVELKAIYKNIRAGFDGNLREPMPPRNAFLIVSNVPSRPLLLYFSTKYS